MKSDQTKKRPKQPSEAFVRVLTKNRLSRKFRSQSYEKASFSEDKLEE